MKDDNQIQCEGMKILIKHLGLVEAGRFIMLVKRDHFDYTEWRSDYYKDKTVEEIFPEYADILAKIKEEEKAKKRSAKPVKAKPATRAARKPAAKRKATKQLVPA